MKLLPIPPTSSETEHEKHNAADNLGATTNSADLYEAWGYMLDNQLQHNGITQLRTVTVTQLVNALEKIVVTLSFLEHRPCFILGLGQF